MVTIPSFAQAAQMLLLLSKILPLLLADQVLLGLCLNIIQSAGSNYVHFQGSKSLLSVRMNAKDWSAIYHEVLLICLKLSLVPRAGVEGVRNYLMQTPFFLSK